MPGLTITVACRVLGCQVVRHCLKQLAQQYQYVKFITMLSTDCIPNYPDSNVPTLLVYKDGQCRRTIVGLRTLGVDRISPESASSARIEMKKSDVPQVLLNALPAVCIRSKVHLFLEDGWRQSEACEALQVLQLG